MNDLTTLPNVGKVIAGKLEKIGIRSKEDFLERDPYEVFDELLKKVDPTLCRCALSSIIGAHRKTKWNLVMKEAVTTFEKNHPDHEWVNC